MASKTPKFDNADMSKLYTLLQGDIGGLRDELRKEISELRDELRKEISESSNGLREELRKEISESKDELRREFGDDFTKLYVHMEKRFSRVDEQFDDVKQDINQVRNTLDDVIGELKILREENDVHGYSVRRIDDSLDDHETRIKQLETIEAERAAA